MYAQTVQYKSHEKDYQTTVYGVFPDQESAVHSEWSQSVCIPLQLQKQQSGQYTSDESDNPNTQSAHWSSTEVNPSDQTATETVVI